MVEKIAQDHIIWDVFRSGQSQKRQMLTGVYPSITVSSAPTQKLTLTSERWRRVMITVPAHRVKQFGVEFFQASFSAKDIDRLVKFEVLGDGSAGEPPGAGERS